MSKKLLYIDVETTGISHERCGIVEIAIIIEIDGKIVETYNSHVKPFKDDEINKEALDKIGLTIDDLLTFPDANKVYWEVVNMFDKYIDKYNKDKSQKFYPIGYNVQFDLDFLANFFRKNGNKYIGSYFNWKKIDILQMLYWMHFKEKINLDSYKLENVCEHFCVPVDAHSAISDIKATRYLFKLLNERLKFDE